MDRQRRIVLGIEAAMGWCGRVAEWLVLATVALSFLSVLLRFVFRTGSVGLQESYVWANGFAVMLAAGWVLARDAHVRVDVLYRPARPVVKAWIDLIGTCLLLAPVCILILLAGTPYAAESWRLLERSREAGGLAGVYLLKTAIVLFALLLLLQGLAMVIRAWRIIVDRPLPDAS